MGAGEAMGQRLTTILVVDDDPGQLAAAKRLRRARQPAMRIALLTGHLTLQVAADASAAKANLIAPKPQRLRQLVATLLTVRGTGRVLADDAPRASSRPVAHPPAPMRTVVRAYARQVVDDLDGNKAQAASYNNFCEA